LYVGVHSDDAAGNAYADCSAQFIAAMSAAVRIGTYEKIHVVAPFLCQKKSDVVKVGLELGAPYQLTRSCYERGDKPCGKCATCIDRARAFELNGVTDPALA
ncbi:MAG: 7-cyano-7-deazaguanine synthase, partial [Selenomonadaceae bacterium]|nr:7-cyano-7-deazaguanine synthase [Selenomonadaceae bacterium]